MRKTASLYFITEYRIAIKFDHVMNLGFQITGIVQDDDGFFWIVSSNRLKRYDGLEIKSNRSALLDCLYERVFQFMTVWILSILQGLYIIEHLSLDTQFHLLLRKDTKLYLTLPR